jgi:hypothetical protein
MDSADKARLCSERIRPDFYFWETGNAPRHRLRFRAASDLDGIGCGWAKACGRRRTRCRQRFRTACAYDGAASINGGTITCAGKSTKLATRLLPAGKPVEINRTISLAAVDGTSADWETVPGLGSRASALRSKLDLSSAADVSSRQPLTYDFQTSTATDAKLKIVAIPSHPLTSANGSKLAIRLDGGPVQVLDFETFGRSEEWKQNVLTNTAARTLPLSQLPGGKHRLEVFAVDPGFLLDRIDVKLDGAPDTYGAP